MYEKSELSLLCKLQKFDYEVFIVSIRNPTRMNLITTQPLGKLIF